MDAVEIIIPSVEELSRQPEKNVCCPEEGCGMVFQTRSSQRMHVVQTHGLVQSDGVVFGHGRKQKKKPKLFYCPVKDCSRALSQQKPFQRRNSLRQHYFSCHGDKTFICSKCGRGFGTATIQKRHETTCGQIFHCTCQCPFTSRESLLMHAKRQGHTLPVQYQRLPLPKKQKTMKPNQQVLILPTSAPSQAIGFTRKPNFILPKPKVMSASQAALLHPENTTIVTVNNGVITDIKEIKPVQISQGSNFTQTVKLNIKDVLCKKPSKAKPHLSDAQDQWSAIYTQTVDLRQDNSTNTHLNEHVADQQVQVLPEMLTVGTNFPGVPETDAHTQTNIKISNRDKNCTQTNSPMQVMNVGNSMSDALVQTMPLFRGGGLASDPCNASGQNMETQTSSDLLLEAMMSAMLQRQDGNQQPSVIISGVSPLDYSVPNQHQPNPPSDRHLLVEERLVRNFGGSLTGSQTTPQRLPVKVVSQSSRASLQTQTQNLVTSMNQATGITNPQYSNVVPSTSQQIITIPTDQRSFQGSAQRQGSPLKYSRKRSLPPNTRSSTDTQTAVTLEHAEHLPFGQYGQREENRSQESRHQSQERSGSVCSTTTLNVQHGYLSCLERRSCSAESHQNVVSSNVEERSLLSGLTNCAETNTIGIQAENNTHENNDDNSFSSIELLDPFSDLGDVFLESIATQTYSNEQPLSTLDNFMQGTSQRDLTPAPPEVSSVECSARFSADSWTPTSIQKSFMGESFEDLLRADSGSQTDEFPEFIFENQFIENASKTILPPNYETEDNQENGSMTEHSLEQAVDLDGFSGLDVGQIDVTKTHDVCDVNQPERSSNLEETKSSTLQTSPGIERGIVSSGVSEVAGSRANGNTSVDLEHLSNVDETSADKDVNDGRESFQSVGGNPDEMFSPLGRSDGLSIEREVNICGIGFSDVETQADIYPLKRSRFSAVMSNNETQTKLNASATSSHKLVPAGGTQVKPNIVLTASSLHQPQGTPAQPTDYATHISKVNAFDSFQNVERSSTKSQQRRDVPRYCNAEIQADIIVINRNKEDVTETSNMGTTSVETQTKHRNPSDRCK